MENISKCEEAAAVKSSEFESQLNHLKEQVNFLRENYFRLVRAKVRIQPELNDEGRIEDLKKQPTGILATLNSYIEDLKSLNESTEYTLKELDKLV